MIIIFAAAAAHMAPIAPVVELTDVKDMYVESVSPGRVIGPMDSSVLCASDEQSAKKAMNKMAHSLYRTGFHGVDACTLPMKGDWRVVRPVANKCLMHPGGLWCEVEAHAVLAERDGKRKYAVILVTADQLD